MKVRVTMFPDNELDVSPQEYTDLARQGLLLAPSLPKRLPEGIALPADVTETKGN
jgi:hypothetical protein